MAFSVYYLLDIKNSRIGTVINIVIVVSLVIVWLKSINEGESKIHIIINCLAFEHELSREGNQVRIFGTVVR